MLNTIQLQTLQTVLRTGSFANAARELGYTGSAVSQQMAALERATRSKLFERDAHGVQPTPTAYFVADRANQVLGQLRTLEDDIVLRQNGTIGRVRVGSFPTASERLIPAALSRFGQSHPGVDVHLDEGEPEDLFGRLEAHEIDLALVYRYGTVPRKLPRGLRTERLLREELLLLLPASRRGHPADPLPVSSLSDFAADSWIATQSGTAGATTLHRLTARAGFEPTIVHRSNNYAVIHGLVAAGLGVALVPTLGHRPGDGVRAIPLDNGSKEKRDAFREVLVARTPDLADGAWVGLVAALRAAADDLEV